MLRSTLFEDPTMLVMLSLYLLVVRTIGTVLSAAISTTSAVATMFSDPRESTTDLGAVTVTTGIVSLSFKTMQTLPS